MKQAGWRVVVKKSIDRVVGAAALVATAPLMACTALAVRLSMGSPVLFRQERPGYQARPFQILKFRTMRDATDAEGRSLPDAERLTKLGTFLRATSLDELPQLINVIRGELSLVGPRPLLMAYLPRYSEDKRGDTAYCPGSPAGRK